MAARSKQTAFFDEPSSTGSLFAEVVFNLPLDQTFTYTIPENLREQVQPGVRVFVSFGTGRQTGYVVGLTDQTDPDIKLKPILEVPDSEPLLSASMLELTRWIADYYQAGWGEVIRAALPAGLEEEIPEVFHLAGQGAEALESGNAPKKEFLILDALSKKGKRTAKQLRKQLGAQFNSAALNNLRSRGDIVATLPNAKSSAQYKLQKTVLVKQDVLQEEIDRLLSRAKKQKELFALLQKKPITLAELSKVWPGYSPLLSQLKQKGLVETRQDKQERTWDASRARTESPTTAPPFTIEQEAAYQKLGKHLAKGKFACSLLEGVTGSGKTEIYMRCIEKGLERGKSAIVLVPEIALTPQTAYRFRSRFGNRVAILHSGLTNIERFLEWRRIRDGEVSIVVGARSAVFAPFTQLGVVIIDEEHDGSYKQDTSPRYHARDAAIVRARQDNALVVLGSATPSLETRSNAQQGKYTHLKLDKRIGKTLMPVVHLVDMRIERDKRKNFSILSRQLQRALGERLERGEQSFLFLNRRGTANYVLCKACGFVFDCPNCSVSLTFHGTTRKLLCHYCGFNLPQPMDCPDCKGEVIRFSGFGTQKLEDETRKRFPDARIARLDRDTARKRSTFEDMFDKMNAGEIDILIGTQMITKGHDFPNVTLVGVVYADLSLHVPDFRSSERSFQLLTQVAGRAGRGEIPGEVFVQAHQLEHPVYPFVARHNYKGFFAHEMEMRERLHFPPYSRLAVVEVEGEIERDTEVAVQQLAEVLHPHLEEHIQVEMLGPARAALYRLQDRYRWHLILRTDTHQPLQDILKALRADKAFQKLASGKIKFTIDVDPLNML
ncbi:MAG: primosomal protein N' [Candidatus Nitronauta litoralis]|uniref:Replication restart protein PriA n=1 Tax=Candidatus Nitronauta litoralis TaxID=2705533 RepID=A0A7T0BUA0_9BACT|nr:MAG: primosomal protein N' [Candidatus Nitronauta litoralis]